MLDEVVTDVYAIIRFIFTSAFTGNLNKIVASLVRAALEEYTVTEWVEDER